MQGTSFADAGPAILRVRNPNPPKDIHPGPVKIPAFPAGNLGRPCREGFRASREQFRRRRRSVRTGQRANLFYLFHLFFSVYQVDIGSSVGRQSQDSPRQPAPFQGVDPVPTDVAAPETPSK